MGEQWAMRGRRKGPAEGEKQYPKDRPEQVTKPKSKLLRAAHQKGKDDFWAFLCVCVHRSIVAWETKVDICVLFTFF